MSPRHFVTVTELGEYVRYHSCQRRFKLGYDGRAEARRLPFVGQLFGSIDPVLQDAGRLREEAWGQSLEKAGVLNLYHSAATEATVKYATWADLFAGLAVLPTEQHAYAREVEVSGTFGAFTVAGRVDFAILTWVGGVPRLRLVECKASRRDRTYHRIQVALYSLIVRQLLDERPMFAGGVALHPNQVDCVVARIDEDTNEGQAILDLAPLDLSQEEADVRRLLADDGALRRIIASPLDSLDYQLNAKCDDCVFSSDCYPESARLRKLQLLGLEPNVVRALESVGIENIDHLADLGPADPRAEAARTVHGLTHSLTRLQQLAHARRSTLPGGACDPDTYEVEPLPNCPQSQLPEHVIEDRRLVRVYLTVHYDYVEARIGALAAHVTASEGILDTRWTTQNGRSAPDPEPHERIRIGTDEDGKPEYEYRSVSGIDVDCRYKSSPWTGRYDEDTASEREILQGFFDDVVHAIAAVAQAATASVHVYTWTRSEMAHLVEACSRVGSGLLGHLRELLGCREPTEQLIYSCLEDEVHTRYALGWTGRGLVVATSLRWFGRRYHWRRMVAGSPVDLDAAYMQDIFDFRARLWSYSSGWARKAAPGASAHTYEVRSRYHDTLSAPYWRALWGTLPDPDRLPPGSAKLARSIRQYQQGGERGRFRAYLSARAQALRWIDESVQRKNPEIRKPVLRIAELLRFSLGVEGPAAAAVDVLRLDHHVALTDWTAAHLAPPASRAASGRTLPLRNLQCLGAGVLTARIDTHGYGVTLDSLQEHCPIGPGAWVRVTPCNADPHRGQTVNQLLRAGSTCEVLRLDWENGDVELSVRPPMSGDRYRLPSYSHREPGDLYPHATLDESPSNYVLGKVDDRLCTVTQHHAYRWLDAVDPQVTSQAAPEPQRAAQYAAVLDSLNLKNGPRLSDDQQEAALEGLDARISLLQGPPGTGKTTTTAASVLLRVLAHCAPGDVVLVAANTHAAVDNLLTQICRTAEPFRAACRQIDLAMPQVRIARVDGRTEMPGRGAVEEIRTPACVRRVQALTSGAVLIAGGTVNGMMKLACALDKSAAFGGHPTAFQARVLVIDEASMMVYPHFLALATMVEPAGEILLAGDHRQLAPILAHDWEREDRPPVVLYQPFASAYDAVRNIARRPGMQASAVRESKLRYTFRLPAVVRDLVARLYRLDDIVLDGLPAAALTPVEGGMSIWERLWHPDGGLFVVVHSETQSTSSNPVEVAIIAEILNAAGGRLAGDSAAIITPHRAQRSLLTQRLACFAGPHRPVGVIDTVERLQGDERPHIIVSATQSDPVSIAARAAFVLDANRTNVAFSRAKERLIVVCAQSLLDHIPTEFHTYQSAMMWKSLRDLCSEEVGMAEVAGHRVRILTPPLSRAGASGLSALVGGTRA